MAGSIKGIIVKIGGDTSGLQKALSKVNSATSSLNKELKGINSLLKLDPKNTELLKQKQDVLNKSIDETRNKLTILQEAKEEADKKMAEGTKINEENYRALQREIINTESKLKKLELENDPFYNMGKKVEEFGDKVKTTSDRINKLSNKLTVGLTVPITAGFTAMTKDAIEFESAFTGVTKTVDATDEQLEELKQGIKDLSEEIPSTTTEIAEVAEAAGQLGIKTENILDFSKAMIDLGNSTNLTSEQAASQLAKFANIMQMSQKDFDKLGSAIVDLGNNYATTEADIVNMSMRLAGAGKQVGLSEGQVLGLATALSSVGIEAEMGGSAISKAMVKMQNAVESGGTKLDVVLDKTGMSLRELELLSANNSKDFKALSDSIGMTSTEVKNLITAGTNLEDFAAVSGMTVEQFKKSWKEDAAGALSAFIQGLGDAETKGESAITMLSDMGLTEVRLRDSLLRAANAGDLFNSAIEKGTDAWKDNTALANEANKRYATTESQLKIMKNKVKDVSISLGDKLLPVANKLLDKADKGVDKLDNLSDAQKENIVKIGLWVATAGPALKVVGTLGNTIGTTVKSIGTFSKAVGVMTNKTTSTVPAVNNLAKVLSGLTSPAGLAATGTTLAVGIIVAEIAKAEAETREKFESMGNAANDFYTGIQTAEGYLDKFNDAIFASSQEQQELQNQMDEIQAGITKICKTASDERRDYTQQEITQLDEYFTKLRELQQRELEIEQHTAEAIIQSAKTESEKLDLSLEEYKQRSIEWIATAQQQADKQIEASEKTRINTIALLNEQYSEAERIDGSEYDRKVKQAEADYQLAVETANKQVGEVSSIYAKGYEERANQDGDFAEHIKHYYWEQEQEENRHNAAIEGIKNSNLLDSHNKFLSIEQENYRHEQEQKKVWKNMYKNMSESEAEQLGSWLAMLSQTELYGGEISEENQKMVDSIMESYDSMPKKTREAMKNVMSPMLDEMQKSEPLLWEKASGIANGILSRLKKSFDIHSPSRETRDIFQNVMKGAELGLNDEQNKLNKQVDTIANQMKSNFSNILPNMGAIKQSVIDQTKTVFTTPSIIINAQDELTPAKINSIIDTVNRRLGSQY